MEYHGVRPVTFHDACVKLLCISREVSSRTVFLEYIFKNGKVKEGGAFGPLTSN